jgi:N-acetylmuramoyl-L-alanine amidase
LKGGQSLTKIYLDAGHGGNDSGAVGNGLYEKNVVVDLVNRIEDILTTEYNNVEVMQTRTTDTFLSLSERTNKANQWGANAFVSVHLNASENRSAKGYESYIYPNVGDETIAFQNIMHQEITKQISGYSGVTDRGKKRANFHVLRESNMIAILTENLFVSNTADASLLKKSEFLQKLAYGHAVGLEKFFGLERTIRPPNNDTGELYQVIAGTFSDYENAESMVKKLKADGYDCYINKK